jgi:hypothetical protein
MNRFLELIENKKFYFASANQFKDPFEGAVAIQPFDFPIDPRYSELDHVEKAFAELKKLTKISCWHIENHESDAMWKLYSGMGKGVAITSTPKKIEVSLEPYRIKPTYGIEELWGANVSYIDLMQERLKVSMLERFFYKHNAFSWEKEFRLAISVRTAEEFGVEVPEDGINVNATIDTLLEEIHIGPSLNDSERTEVIKVCDSLGFGNRVKVSSLLGRPRYV